MYKNPVKKIIMPTIIAASMVVGMYLGLYISPNRTAPSKVARTAETKTSYLLKLIEHNYVDSVSINDIQEKIIPEILAELDPHSVYIPYEDMSDANEALDGKFDGIGVVFNMMTDTVVVLNVISGGPSFKAGIVAGDRIIKVGDKNIAGQSMPQDSVVKLLRGPRDTEVNLMIERSGVSSNMTIPVIRGVIPIKSLDAAFMIAPQVGFVKLSRFSRTSYKELIEALSSFKQQGMTRLIFDLRGNSGGFLDQAIMIANEFLAANKLIVYTEDKNKRQTRQYSDGQGQFSDVELMMLIDEGSASSSEILSGAMQDNDRAMIIGRRSFGKGLVQEQVPFSDGSAVRLTVARYYTPTGRSIQKPYDNGSDKYEEEVLDRYMHDEFFNADSIKFDSTLRFTTPEGRIVYGGGGIMPDKFVPADSTRYSRNTQNILRENLIYRFALKFCDAHREQLNKIQTLSELDDFYKANDIYAEFVNYVRANSKGVNASSLSSDRKLLLPQLKAIVGRNTPLEDNAFYYYIAEIDDVLKVALQQE